VFGDTSVQLAQVHAIFFYILLEPERDCSNTTMEELKNMDQNKELPPPALTTKIDNACTDLW
jgi:hypothetical protein